MSIEIDPISIDLKRTFNSALVGYFGDLDFVKVDQIDGKGIYMAKLACQLINEFKYIIVMVNNDKRPVRLLKKISELDWDVFQTRFMKENRNLPIQSHLPHHYKPLEDAKIKLVTKNESFYGYNCDVLPIRVDLFPKDKIGFDYQPQGNLLIALETFHTSIAWI